MYPTPNDVGFGATECSICLEEFTDGAWVRVLPSCHHIYHPTCIQKWMTTRKAFCLNLLLFIRSYFYYFIVKTN
ncbi:hypothetical protein RHMOL_Rhmol04G0280100 [Rhododendron molle]|uniref:Uncharacterized protein n=1 Tax=Rhododendron molle TaxID=49168 RepID=A0ACC0P5C2_RHOML|nr:hypothetical protein RHMOL_Rhmol04G0280100 [Rhododendron molle]